MDVFSKGISSSLFSAEISAVDKVAVVPSVVGNSEQREPMDYVEMASLGLLICFGTLLNLIAFVRLIRFSRNPSLNGAKSVLTGPLYMNSFTLLKFNLALTDFAILLVHALGKLVWLLSYRWLFGDTGCRIYQFLSAFTYYSNSNVVVAIGLDRLKVVYSSKVEGTCSSIRRVRLFLLIAWALAAICALPQLFFWTNFELRPNWSQCTTIWEIAAHLHSSSSSPFSTNGAQNSPRHWSASQQTQLYYELLHQAAVFLIPFISLFACYLAIVVRVIRYTFRPNSMVNYYSCSSLIAADNWSGEEPLKRRLSYQVSLRLRRFGSRCLLHKLHLVHQRKEVDNEEDRANSPNRLALPVEGQPQSIDSCNYPVPPPSPNPVTPTASSEGGSGDAKHPFSVSNNLQELSRKSSADVLLLAGGRAGLLLMANQKTRKFSADTSSCGRLLTIDNKRRSLVSSAATGNGARSRQTLLCSDQVGPSSFAGQSQHGLTSSVAAGGRRHTRQSLGRRSMCSIGGGGNNSLPMWRRQLRSKVFVRSLLIVAAHCAFWLPYNLLNLCRFLDEHLYSWLVERGALLVEDLIVMNAMINPILYGYGA